MANSSLSIYWQLLIALLAGAGLSYAFQPYHIWVMAWLSPAVLLWLWLQNSPKQAFFTGGVFGLGFFGLGIYWVFISIHYYGQTSIWLAGLVTALFIVVLALVIAIQGWVTMVLGSRHHRSTAYLLFPSIWCLGEWLRGWLFTGFPWLYIGTTQLQAPLQGFVPILGVYGVSLLTLIAAASLLEYQKPKRTIIPVTLLLLLTLISWGLHQVSWTQAVQPARRISLLQGNIPQSLKWEPQGIINTIKTYTKMTRQVWKSDLIVWPETAIPALESQVSDFIGELDSRAQTHQTAVIVGIPVHENDHYYNALLMLGPQKGKYFKRHLVPFGEYIPLYEWLHGLMNLFRLPPAQLSAGAEDQPLLTPYQHFKLAPFICYEIAYPHEVLRHAQQSNALLVITNDAWFGRSAAQAQHLAIAQLRALETGRCLAFASNNGITALINAQGQLIKQIPAYQRDTLTGSMTPRQGRTPLMYYGHELIILLLLGLGITGLIINRIA